MSKYKFTPDIWITFYDENNFHVGRTLFENNMEVVACVSEKGETKIIPYSRISNQKQLKLLKNMAFSSFKPEESKSSLDFNTADN